MLTVKVKHWLSQFRQYYFNYSNGFYHLPCNANSPQNLVESFSRLPFVKHSREKQCVSSNNPFCEGGFYYQQLEEGCWILYSKMRYKANVAYDLLREMETDEAGPENYYMLSLNNINNTVQVDNTICEKQLCFPQYSWTFFKPNERNCDLNFKGAANKYITFYFSASWLQKNLVPNSLFAEGGLNDFIQSDDRYIVWSLSAQEAVLKNFDLFDKAMNIGGSAGQVDLLQLKFYTLNLIFDFCKLCKEQEIISRHITIDYKDKFSMNKVEHYLSNHLLDKFPGIDFLAKKFQVSETRLKAEFKQLFGKPVYQYFQEKQMQLALEILRENQLLIKEISYKFGYESTSKFTAAFKKHHGVLPSEVQ